MKENLQLEIHDNSCQNCQAKDQSLAKCMQLITLLKKKAKKYDDSRLRESQSLQSNTIRSIQSSQQSLKAKILLLLLKQTEKKQLFISFQSLKRCDNMHRQSHQFSKVPLVMQTKDKLYQIETSQSIGEIKVKKVDTLPVLSLAFDKQIEALQKNRLKNSFQLMIQNKRIGQRVKFLEQELEDSLRRQEKEISKKRQSLSGLVEELSEKNQLIEELRSNIKLLQSKLGAKENGILQCMLEEDSQALRKVVFRLQNINDKLNIDLQKHKKDKNGAEFQNKQMKVEIQNLKGEIKKLKEENFDLQHDRQNVKACKKQIQFISHKVAQKIERIHKLQKKWNEAARSKVHIKNTELDNILQSKLTKKTSTECTDSLALHQSASHYQEIQQKLEAVFIYLFHINDMSFKLASPELFDQEEKELLSAHKEKFLKKSHHQSFIAKKCTKNICVEEDHFEINPFGDSLIDILNQDLVVKQKCDIKSKQEDTNESQKLIEKISELKERNLYVRSVLLSLMKSLQLKSIKKDTQGILTMLSDYFEYSETERNQIFQIKSKKLFGFI